MPSVCPSIFSRTGLAGHATSGTLWNDDTSIWNWSTQLMSSSSAFFYNHTCRSSFPSIKSWSYLHWLRDLFLRQHSSMTFIMFLRHFRSRCSSVLGAFQVVPSWLHRNPPVNKLELSLSPSSTWFIRGTLHSCKHLQRGGLEFLLHKEQSVCTCSATDFVKVARIKEVLVHERASRGNLDSPRRVL